MILSIKTKIGREFTFTIDDYDNVKERINCVFIYEDKKITAIPRNDIKIMMYSFGKINGKEESLNEAKK